MENSSQVREDIKRQAMETILYSLREFFDIQMTKNKGRNYIGDIYRYYRNYDLSRNKYPEDAVKIRILKEKIAERSERTLELQDLDVTLLFWLIRYSRFKDDVYRDVPLHDDREYINRQLESIKDCRNFYMHEAEKMTCNDITREISSLLNGIRNLTEHISNMEKLRKDFEVYEAELQKTCSLLNQQMAMLLLAESEEDQVHHDGQPAEEPVPAEQSESEPQNFGYALENDNRGKLVRIYLRQGNFEKAQTVLDQILMDHPEDPIVWMYKAMAALQIRDEADFVKAGSRLKTNEEFRTALDLAQGELLERLTGYLNAVEEESSSPTIPEGAGTSAKHEENEAAGEAEDTAPAANGISEQTDPAGTGDETKTEDKPDPEAGGKTEQTEGPEAAETPSKPEPDSGRRKPTSRIYTASLAEAQKYEWKAQEDGTLQMTRYTCSGFQNVSGVLQIPGLIMGKPVSEIGYRTFACLGWLKNADLSDGIVTIGEKAFIACKNLTDIRLPAGLMTIGAGAFMDCSALQIMVVPESVKSIREGAFRFCSALRSVVIPAGVTEIGSSAFEKCTSLTDVTVPSSVTVLGEKAFLGCTHLWTAGLGSGIETIQAGTFDGCVSLSSVNLPAGVTEIGAGAFRNCSSLTHLVIPSGVKVIDAHAFEGCKSLRSISIPPAVESIREDAFTGCESLISVSIPAHLMDESRSAFRNCPRLTISP